MNSTPEPFKPADLIERIGSIINEVVSPFDQDGYVYTIQLGNYGRDNWSVDGIITVTGPYGKSHRLRLEVHDTHYSGETES